MFIDLKKTLFLLATAPLALGACGGDDDDGGKAADAAPAVIDAAPGDPDAAPDPTFAGTISLAEVSVTNPALAEAGVAGAVVNIGFTDPLDVTVDPAPGYDNNVGACKIIVYDVANGELPPKGSDGGPVTIGGTNGTVGAAFGCAYNATADAYACSSADSAAAGVLPIGTTVTPTGVRVRDSDHRRRRLLNENYVGMKHHPRRIPRRECQWSLWDRQSTGQCGQHPDHFQFRFGGGLDSSAESAVPDPHWRRARAGGAASVDFLDDGTADVTIAKDAITNVPAIDSSLTVNGSGFKLADDSTLPHAVPLDGTAATFSCAGTGECGTAVGVLKGIIVFGSTTDGVLDPTDPTDMPDPVQQHGDVPVLGHWR